MSKLIWYVNGNFVEADEATLPVNDLGIVRGYGVFDALRTYDDVPFKLREHLERLQTSAHDIDLELPWSLGELEEIVCATFDRNEIANASLRIIVTGGVAQDLITPPDAPSLAVMVMPFKARPPELYANGVKVITFEAVREMPTVKKLNYIGAVMAMQKAKKANAFDAIYKDVEGWISEGTRANLFAVRGQKLITPEKDVLNGITRNVFMEIATNQMADEVEVVLGELHYDELITADEVFITSSGAAGLPIVQVDEHQIGDGKPGPVTLKLQDLFRVYIDDYCKQKV